MTCVCTRRPPRRIRARSQTCSTSEITWDEKMTVRPACLASRTSSATSARTVGSRFEVGSSRITSGVSTASVTARASFCRMPVDMADTPRERSRPNRSPASATRPGPAAVAAHGGEKIDHVAAAHRAKQPGLAGQIRDAAVHFVALAIAIQVRRSCPARRWGARIPSAVATASSCRRRWVPAGRRLRRARRRTKSRRAP